MRMFQFDRRSARQMRAERALLVGVPVAVLAYLPLDIVLSQVLGGYWGVLSALVVSGMPVAALFRVALADRPVRGAVLDGAALALAGAALYAWGFGGSW